MMYLKQEIQYSCLRKKKVFSWKKEAEKDKTPSTKEIATLRMRRRIV